MIDQLLEALSLKDLPRSGWVRHGVLNSESVADHSWGVALLVLMLLPDPLNMERALKYAVLHDLPEVRTGDPTPQDPITKEEKSGAERKAIEVAFPQLLASWEAYEAQADPEARFVRQLDRLDMALQAVLYAERANTDLSEFLDSAEKVIEDPELRRLMAQLRARIRSEP